MVKPVVPMVRTPTSINIDREVWKRFKAACAADMKTVTAQMERLIVNWLNLQKVAPKHRTP